MRYVISLIRRNALQGLSRLGVAQPFIKLYDSTIGLAADYDEFDIDIESDSVSGDKGTVVFPYAHHAKSHTYKYSILAQAFKIRGYRPLFVLPNNCLPMSCMREDNPEEDVVCEVREYSTKKVLKEFGHEWMYLTEYVSDRSEYEDISFDRINTTDYKGINLEDFAKASTRKITKKYHLDTEYDESIRRRFLQSGVLLTDAYERVIDSHDPVVMIAHDDKYNQGGIPLAVADTSDVHAYSSTYGWMNESLVVGNVGHQNSFPHYEAKSIVDRFLRRPLDGRQRERVNEIMADRMFGDEETRARYAARTDRSITTAEGVTTVGLFTNLIWDANLEVTNCPYPNVFEWIQDTISILSGDAATELVIKPHPAEDSRGTNESVRGWITETYSDLPDNVTVLTADTDVNTYQMLEDIDVGIVYNSTVGFEMVYAGVPAITAGETHYRDLDISLDPATAGEYRDMLHDLSEIELDEERRRRAERYIYFLLEGKHLDFPFIHTSNVRNYEYRPVSDEDIENNDVFDRIVKRCTNGQPVFIPELDWLIESPAESVN